MSIHLRALFVCMIGGIAIVGCVGHQKASTGEPLNLALISRCSGYEYGEELFHDDFNHPSDQWVCEFENGGTLQIGGGQMDLQVPAGATVWFRPRLEGPVMIQYAATVCDAGGPDDRVSDLNCFWMARDARCPEDLFAKPRSGRFEDYNQLLGYYASIRGNSNTTTRFRRYIGSPTTRPLLPQHDLRDAGDLLKPNIEQRILLVADGNLIQFCRDGRRVFELKENHPYTSGWFGFRTTHCHLQIRDFSVRRLLTANH